MPGSYLLSTVRTSVVCVAALWLLPAAAGAQDLLSTTVSAGSAAQRQCFERPAAGAAGVVSRQVAAPMSGIVGAKLNAAGGDWDLAVFDVHRSHGGRLGGLQRRRGRFGIHRPGRHSDRAGLPPVRLGRQRHAGRGVCARPTGTSGREGPARERRHAHPVPEGPREPRWASTSPSMPAATSSKSCCTAPRTPRSCARPGFTLQGRRSRTWPRATARTRSATSPSRRRRPSPRCPSGVDAYRHLWEYEYALKELARHYPNLVQPITLPLQDATRAARSRESRSPRTPEDCATASPCSCSWACTTRASGRRASTRWSSPSTSP